MMYKWVKVEKTEFYGFSPKFVVFPCFKKVAY